MRILKTGAVTTPNLLQLKKPIRIKRPARKIHIKRPIVVSSLTEFCLELAHSDGESDVGDWASPKMLQQVGR